MGTLRHVAWARWKFDQQTIGLTIILSTQINALASVANAWGVPRKIFLHRDNCLSPSLDQIPVSTLISVHRYHLTKEYWIPAELVHKDDSGCATAGIQQGMKGGA